jgi:hypothetical protein
MEAEEALRDARAIHNLLAADSPKVAAWSLELARSERGLAAFLWRAGRLKEAEAGYNGTQAIQKQAKAKPGK